MQPSLVGVGELVWDGAHIGQLAVAEDGVLRDGVRIAVAPKECDSGLLICGGTPIDQGQII